MLDIIIEIFLLIYITPVELSFTLLDKFNLLNHIDIKFLFIFWALFFATISIFLMTCIYFKLFKNQNLIKSIFSKIKLRKHVE